MKKALIFVLTGFLFIATILLGRTANAQQTQITSQFMYGLDVYVLDNGTITPDFTMATYHKTIGNEDFITSGLYKNWCDVVIPSNITGYIYIVDSSHSLNHLKIGCGWYSSNESFSTSWEPQVTLKYYDINFAAIARLNIPRVIEMEGSYGLDFIYYEIAPENIPRTKIIDYTTNENDYVRVQQNINGYDIGYNNGYTIGYNDGQQNGYNNGYNDGQQNGYSSGYQKGQYDMYQECYPRLYDEGYAQGLIDGSNPNYVQIQYYNQLLQNNNFETQTIWETRNATYSVSDNNSIIIAQNNDAAFGLVQTIPQVTSGHITLCIFNVYASGNNSRVRLRYPYQSDFINITTTKTKYYIYYNNQTLQELTNFYIQFSNPTYSNNTITLSDINFIDLTKMYGSGNEPSLNECRELFTLDYYPYSTGEIANLGYINGYNDGKVAGYDEGVSYQATQQLTADGWIKNIFVGIGSFLALEILPGVSIGLIVGIPFIISVAWFVIKMARGGGNN